MSAEAVICAVIAVSVMCIAGGVAFEIVRALRKEGRP
jgi:ribosomal protein S25